MPGIAFLEAAVGIPGAFLRIDLVKRSLHRVVPGNVVEDEEFVLGAEVRRVRDAGRFQVRLCALGERARATVIALHRRGLDDVAAQVEGDFVRENVDRGG